MHSSLKPFLHPPLSTTSIVTEKEHRQNKRLRSNGQKYSRFLCTSIISHTEYLVQPKANKQCARYANVVQNLSRLTFTATASDIHSVGEQTHRVVQATGVSHVRTVPVGAVERYRPKKTILTLSTCKWVLKLYRSSDTAVNHLHCGVTVLLNQPINFERMAVTFCLLESTRQL